MYIHTHTKNFFSSKFTTARRVNGNQLKDDLPNAHDENVKRGIVVVVVKTPNIKCKRKIPDPTKEYAPCWYWQV